MRGIDFIGAWSLEDDLGPALVGDFHQAGGQGVLAAQGDGRAGRSVLRIGPAAIGHARDPADKLRLFSGGRQLPGAASGVSAPAMAAAIRSSCDTLYTQAPRIATPMITVAAA